MQRRDLLKAAVLSGLVSRDALVAGGLLRLRVAGADGADIAAASQPLEDRGMTIRGGVALAVLACVLVTDVAGQAPPQVPSISQRP